jgi:hypothetical protein
MDSSERGKEGTPVFESYPAWMTALSSGLSVSIYALGAAIVARLGWGFLAAYLLFLVYLEVNLLRKSCAHCVYYGKGCFSGRGVVCSWLFARRDPSRFSSREVSWLTVLPDLLVTLVPLGVGLFLLIRQFDWILLSMMVGLVILAFPANGLVRGKLACCHCRQRELGCPAEKLFRKRGEGESARTG